MTLSVVRSIRLAGPLTVVTSLPAKRAGLRGVAGRRGLEPGDDQHADRRHIQDLAGVHQCIGVFLFDQSRAPQLRAGAEVGTAEHRAWLTASRREIDLPRR